MVVCPCQLFFCSSKSVDGTGMSWFKNYLRYCMKVIRHAGVDSRMIILDNQARQQMTLHFQLSLQCNVLPITGFIGHTAKKKEKVAMKKRQWHISFKVPNHLRDNCHSSTNCFNVYHYTIRYVGWLSGYGCTSCLVPVRFSMHCT